MYPPFIKKLIITLFSNLVIFSCTEKKPIGILPRPILNAELGTLTGENFYEIRIDTATVNVITLVLKVTNLSGDTLVGDADAINGKLEIWWVDWSDFRFTFNIAKQDEGGQGLISNGQLILKPGQSFVIRKIWRHKDNEGNMMWDYTFFKPGRGNRMETIKLLYNAEARIKLFDDVAEVTSNTTYFRIVYYYYMNF